MKKNATLDQYLQFGHMVSAGAISSELMQAILGGRVEIIDKPREQTGTPYRGGVPSGERSLITVPNLSAAELVAQAQSKLELTHIDSDLPKWDFYKNQRGEVVDVGGKTYEVRSWKPGREVVPATEVRAHFTDGFVGNTPAFIALMMRDNPEGYHASIPTDDRLFRHGGDLYAPRFVRVESRRELRLNDAARARWGARVCFWAFREFKSV